MAGIFRYQIVRSVRNAFSNGPFLDAEDLRTRIRAVIQRAFLVQKSGAERSRIRADFPVTVPMAHRTFNRRNPTHTQAARRMRPCKVLAPNRTKTFHVKQFCPIEPPNRSKLMFSASTFSAAASPRQCRVRDRRKRGRPQTVGA
jgi:hypothetical protein